jgi:hypothetical protein
MDDPPTTNSNNTQNETTPTQPILKTIGKNQTNIHRPLQAGEATHTQILQQGYNPLYLCPVPVNSHKSIFPTTPNTLHKRKLHQVTPTIMAPLSTQTTKNYLKVCQSYNILNGQNKDGTLTIEKLETILVCLKNVGEHPHIDLTRDTPIFPEQNDTPITGNLDIKNEVTSRGGLGNTTNTTASRDSFGNTTPAPAPTDQAVAAKDPTRSTTEQTSTRSNIQEEQEYTDAMQNSLVDIPTVTTGNYNNTLRKKRDRSKGWVNRAKGNKAK